MVRKHQTQAETLSGSPQPNFVGYATAPIIAKRAPTASDTGYPIGQNWVDKVGLAAYELVGVASGSATWTAIGGGSSEVSTINNLPPTAGNITIAGTASQISIANAGSTVTLSLPNAITVPGSLTATTTLHANTTVTSGTTMTAGTGFTSTAGNIVATAGAVNAGTTMTAGTGITATTGNITATTGNFVASAAGAGVVLGGGPKVVAGSGDPNGAVTAPQGSLYLNIAGSGVADRAFINTNGITAWAAVTTAS